MTEISIMDVLVKAREQVAHGWTQGADMDHLGNVCSIGAINLAVRILYAPVPRPSFHHHALANSAADLVGQAIDEVYPHGEDDIIDWNDAAGRTQDDVLYVFDHAIKLADKLADPTPPTGEDHD